MLKIPKNLESKWEKIKNKGRKERPNIKYKLIRLKKLLRVKRIEEISQVDDRDPFESEVKEGTPTRFSVWEKRRERDTNSFVGVFLLLYITYLIGNWFFIKNK